MMKKYYRVKLCIISEYKNNVLKTEQDIIVLKKSNRFQEIVTGNNFYKQITSSYEKGTIGIDSEDIISYYRNGIDNEYTKVLKEYGIYFLIEPDFFDNPNPLVTLDEVKEYLNEFKNSSFKRYLWEYNQKNKGNDIKKLIKKYKRKGVLWRL